jgi:hypothetical protein
MKLSINKYVIIYFLYCALMGCLLGFFVHSYFQQRLKIEKLELLLKNSNIKVTECWQ